MDDVVEVCIRGGCSGERVSGSEYCDDHLLEKQVKASHRQQVGVIGSLADMIRNAKARGFINPVSGYGS